MLRQLRMEPKRASLKWLAKTNEYNFDFEKKVVLSGKYDLDEQDKLQGEYRKALADKVGKFVQNYGDE